MDMKILAAAASGALLLGAGQTVAATIDSFVTDQSVADQPTGTQPTNSEVAASEALGGYRDLYVTTSGTQEADSVLRAGIVDNVLSFSNQAGISGTAWVTYDGNDGDATTVDTTGLGGANLSKGDPTAGLLFEVISLDIAGGLTAGIEAWDMNGENAIFQGPVSAGGDTFVPFASFITTTAGTFDWTDVGALQFFAIADDDVDARIGPITAVPLPASALLLLGGLGGLSAVGMRRRKRS